MAIKITFLGTGPSGRIPRPGCSRPACKDARKKGSKSARLQSSAFFEFPHFNVLIDTTEDFEKQLKRIGGRKIDYVFLTHGHFDAAGGLPALTKFVKQTEMPEVVYTERKTLSVASKEMPSVDLPFHHLMPDKKIDFKDFKLTPFRVAHAYNPEKFPTLGYLFEIGKKKIVYASDFKKMPPKSEKLVRGADLAILDCAGFMRPIPTHIHFPDIMVLIKKLHLKKVYLTQIGIGWPPHNEAARYVKKHAKNVFLAYDGLQITF